MNLTALAVRATMQQENIITAEARQEAVKTLSKILIEIGTVERIRKILCELENLISIFCTWNKNLFAKKKNHETIVYYCMVYVVASSIMIPGR